MITEALRGAFEYGWAMAKLLAPHAARLGLRRGDGMAAMYLLWSWAEKGIPPTPALWDPGPPPDESSDGPRPALRSGP